MNEIAIDQVAVGGDHAGFQAKAWLVDYLTQLGVGVTDCGTGDETPCDFPDIAEKVAMEVIRHNMQRGILVCGSGVGVSVAANKFPGIRASLCHDTYSARQGVEHDDMNVLCVGSRVIGPELIKEVVISFLRARYAPQQRHQRRVDKIHAIEQRALAGEFTLDSKLLK